MATSATANYSGSILPDDVLRQTCDVFLASGMNYSETSRQLGKGRNTIKNRLRQAAAKGMIEEAQIHEQNAPKLDDYLAARERKLHAYQMKKRKGDWRKPVLTTLSPEPYRLKIFGDPHLDADGCNYELFERHWLEMDAESRVFGICVGDWFNNWLRALGHLWKDETSRPSDAWLCLEYLMQERGECLIAACSGNHDDWTHGPADPVDLLMKRYGVIYRKGAVRVAVQHEGCDPMLWAIRHKWQGKSMYSAAHWGVRANREGWRDALLVGGHIHQDDTRLIRHNDGFVSHICQVSAFKEFDDYVDVHGFNGQRISPVWDLVIDPRKSESDPDRIKVFWSSGAAQAYLEALQK